MVKAESPAKPATYVFCLVESKMVPSVRGAPGGMPGTGPVRALPIDRGLWAIVADAPLERYSAARLEQDLQDLEAVSRHALAHAATIEFFFKRSPVIPLKLFTLFSEEGRAQQHLVRRKARRRRLFSNLRGLEEWAVRISSAGGRDAIIPDAMRPGLTGRSYLEAKKQLRNAESPTQKEKKEVDNALRELGRLAANARREKFPPVPGRPYVGGASFLVHARRRATWRKRVARLAAELRKQGHTLDMTGPWPPYHFVAS